MQKKCKIFYANDFQSLMCPCFIFCRILGIFPYKINKSTFEASRLHNALSTIVFCIFCIYGTILLYEIDISGTIMYLNVPRSLERHSYYMFSIFIVIVTYILKSQRLTFLQSILDVSSQLPLKSYQNLARLIHAKDIFGVLFIIFMILIYIVNMPVNSILLTTFETYLSLVLLQMDMLYMNCVCVLKACFKNISDNLAKMQEHIISDKPHLLRRIYHEQNNSFLLIKLKSLERQYLMISDTMQLLNNIFSWQLIITVILSFSEITFNLYFCIILSMVTEKEKFWYLFLGTFVIYYTIKIILIVWACDSGKNQAMKIGNAVHNLLNNTNDKKIQDELHLFSMQILQRKNIFSAKGLTVDATLLTGMVGSITTYLLILIQFLITSHSSKKDITKDLI